MKKKKKKKKNEKKKRKKKIAFLQLNFFPSSLISWKNKNGETLLKNK